MNQQNDSFRTVLLVQLLNHEKHLAKIQTNIVQPKHTPPLKNFFDPQQDADNCIHRFLIW